MNSLINNFEIKTMMKNIDIKYSIALLTLLVFASCSTEDDLRDDIIADSNNPFVPVEITAESGSADFTKYVSVGNSITAGLMDAALYESGMKYSFPNLLAAQFATAGGGDCLTIMTILNVATSKDTRNVGGRHLCFTGGG